MIETKTVTFLAKELKAPDSKGQFMAFIAQTWPEDTAKSNADADGDVFVTGAFDEQNNETVPVFYQHNYAPTSEVGQAKLLPKESRTELPAQGQLKVDQGWPIADAVYESMLLPADDPAALHEFSVGYEYDTKDITKRPDGVRLIRKSRVFELSVVYRGAQRTELVSVKHQNAGSHIQSAHDALVRAGAKCAGTNSDQWHHVSVYIDGEPQEDIKAALRRHSTDTVSSAWDGPAQEARIPNDAGASVFRQMFAWVDPQGDPNTKAAYAFDHHMWDGGAGPANTTACVSGIGICNGGRGADSSARWWGDRTGIHVHLAGHMMDANMEPPPLKSYMDSIEEVRLKLAMETAGL